MNQADLETQIYHLVGRQFDINDPVEVFRIAILEMEDPKLFIDLICQHLKTLKEN